MKAGLPWIKMVCNTTSARFESDEGIYHDEMKRRDIYFHYYVYCIYIMIYSKMKIWVIYISGLHLNDELI